MKNSVKKYLKMIPFLFVIFGVVSCQYEEIVSTDYPAGLIYLPAAVSGIYTIDELTSENLYNPTPGSIFRYQIDKEANKFIIPLSVYRSGMNPGDAVSVEVHINSDTIAQLIANGTLLDTELLPTEKYTVENTPLFMMQGETLADFKVAVDFDYLKTRAPQKFAFGLTVSCSEQQVNPSFNTVIVVVDTKIMIPQAGFSYAAEQGNASRIIFTNESVYGVSYSWSFGDGSLSDETSPVHTYAAPGSYEVELSVTGLYGDVEKITKTVEIN